MKNILTYEDYINDDFNSDEKLYKILGDDPKYKAINVTDKDVSIVSKILGEYYEVTKQRTIGFDEDIKRYSVTRIVTSWRETGKMDHPPKYNIFIYRLADYYYLVAWFNMVESLKYALCDSEAGLEQLLRDLSSQKINEANEKLRDRAYLNECWYNANIGDVVPQDYIYNYVEYLHRNEDDFIDGDIGNRIGQFSKYELTEIRIDRINIDEYELDIDEMKKYKRIFKETNDYPPIILDGDTEWSFRNNYTIIDGNHRVNALHRLGEKTIKAWVGQN